MYFGSFLTLFLYYAFIEYKLKTIQTLKWNTELLEVLYYSDWYTIFFTK